MTSGHSSQNPGLWQSAASTGGGVLSFPLGPSHTSGEAPVSLQQTEGNAGPWSPRRCKSAVSSAMRLALALRTDHFLQICLNIP